MSSKKTKTKNKSSSRADRLAEKLRSDPEFQAFEQAFDKIIHTPKHVVDEASATNPERRT